MKKINNIPTTDFIPGQRVTFSEVTKEELLSFWKEGMWLCSVATGTINKHHTFIGKTEENGEELVEFHSNYYRDWEESISYPATIAILLTDPNTGEEQSIPNI